MTLLGQERERERKRECPRERVYSMNAIIRKCLPVFQNGCKTWKKVFNGWSHFCHTNDIDNSLKRERKINKLNNDN